jgi:NhaA family Na+:H+ antiporter
MCGIGFTMSLFISSLAYSDPALYQESVIGILLASAISALAGYAWLRAALAVRPGQKPA